MDINVLVGKTLSRVSKKDDEEIIFETTTGQQYRMYHRQDCCEIVTIEDIVGDLEDLVGSPIVLAEEVSFGNDETIEPSLLDRRIVDHLILRKLKEDSYSAESETWTFYKLATVRGYVDIRWYGSSNGYYSESVDFSEIGSEDDYY